MELVVTRIPVLDMPVRWNTAAVTVMETVEAVLMTVVRDVRRVTEHVFKWVI